MASGELRRSTKTNDPLSQLVAKFVGNLPLRLASLHTAHLQQDWSEVARQAHQMSGAAGGYGFPEIGRAAARIEALAKDDPNSVILAKSIGAFGVLCNEAMRFD